jgi:hypothetical protein
MAPSVAAPFETVPRGCDIIEADSLMNGTATYVYCIVHAAQALKGPRAPAGLPGGTRPSVVPLARSLWLVVAEVPLNNYGSESLERNLRNVDWVSDIAVAHETVVEYFVRRPGATVVPMKLFTMFSSRERALDDVRARRESVQAIAKRIKGCEEWGVRLMRTAAPVPAGRADRVTSTTGVDFLAAKKEARDRAREAVVALAAVADRAFTALAAMSREARRRGDAPEGIVPPLLDAAFLVPVSQRARFKAAVKRVADETDSVGVDTTLTGPWPAYNFVQSGSAA